MPIDHAMKELVNRPMLLAALLVIPLWFLLDNFVVAAMVALLVAFLVSMIHALRVLKHPESAKQNPKPARDHKETHEQ